MRYKNFRVGAKHNDTRFEVQVKGWFCWLSGFVWTDYFSIQYHSLEEALQAIDNYRNRFTIANNYK